MAAGRLCGFCEILACWRWVWWGVPEFAETKNNCSASVADLGITNGGCKGFARRKFSGHAYFGSVARRVMRSSCPSC